MALATEKVGDTFYDVVAGVPIDCNWPLYSADEVVVVYGYDSLEAVINVDYTVTLDAPDYDLFTITPTASLITKINDLIALDATEINYITIRRKLDYLTSVQPETVRYTAFLSREIERIHMRLQQLAEEVYRSVVVPVKRVGSTAVRYFIDPPEANRGLVWDPTGTKLTNGPDLSSLSAFEDVAADTIADVTASAAAALASENAAAASASLAGDWATVAQNAAAGINWTKARVASTANVNIASPGASIDGVTLVAADRVLLKNQTSVAQNGIYTWNGAAAAMVRVADMNAWSEVVSKVVVIEEGTTNADIPYITTVNAGGTLDTTAIPFIVFQPPLQDGAVSTYAKIASSVLASLADWAAGTASKILTAANFLPALSAAIGFSKFYDSGQLTITTGGMSQAHGLGATPKDFAAYIVCTTTDSGYAVGDTIKLQATTDTGTLTSYYGGFVWASSTQIGCTISTSGIAIYNKSTGAYNTITGTSWRIIFKAWA